MAKTIAVREAGPRDGLRMARGRMAMVNKARWIRAVAASGAPKTEAGSFVPARVIPQMADTGEVVRATRGIAATVAALAGLGGRPYPRLPRRSGGTVKRL